MPTLFKTYSMDHSLGDCKIWEVAQATSASEELYDSVRCGTAQINFTAASSVCNNLCQTVISEACNVYPDCSVGCVLSVGTGSRTSEWLSRTSTSHPIQPSGLGDKVVGKDHKSFRFDGSVALQDIGFLDMTKWAECRAHTTAYIEANRIDIDTCSSTLSGTLQNLIPDSKDLFHFPFPLDQGKDDFLGCGDILSQVRNNFQSHNQVALTGLCGIG